MRRRFILRIASLSLAAALLGPPAPAETDRGEEGGPAAWATFSRIVLRQSAPGIPGFVEWDARFDHATFDAVIEGTMRSPEETIEGTVALVGGRFMLNRGLELEPGYEIDALDMPLLSFNLLTGILDRVFPGGPEQISGDTAIDRADDVDIQYGTPSASGQLPAPWRVVGRAERVSGGEVAFEMDVTFAVEQGGQASSAHTTRMTGRLGMSDGPVFRDDDALAAWTIYRLGPRRIERDGSVIYDYGAWPEEAGLYATIADIRAFIAAESHPGHPDASKDFTGFWKRDCADDFGLRIEPHGEEGRYSVVFCGPGGCGEPSRPTFITGDKGYEVVGESELVQVSQWGERTRYTRCSRETP